jgi:hypothetical protein
MHPSKGRGFALVVTLSLMVLLTLIAVGLLSFSAVSCEAHDKGTGHLYFDIDTMEPIEPPWQAIKEWIADAPLWPCRLQDPPPDLVFHDAPPGCGRSIPDDEPNLDWFNRPRNPSVPDLDGFHQSPAWQPEEIPLGDGRILVLDHT